MKYFDWLRSLFAERCPLCAEVHRRFGDDASYGEIGKALDQMIVAEGRKHSKNCKAYFEEAKR